MKGLTGRILIKASDAYRALLSLFLALIGPRAAYWIAKKAGIFLYGLHQPLRDHCESHVGAALGRQLSDEQIQELARQSFIHRTWDYVDLLIARYRINHHNFATIGGKIRDDHLRLMQTAQEQGKPLILVTCYYGPFDLLPMFLGFNDIRACVVYKRHANRRFDAFRKKVRSKSGCELVPLEDAMDRVTQTLASGGAAALVADHIDRQRGIAVTFLGVPTTALRSVGLLAWRYDAAVVVAGVRRVDSRFRFEIQVADIFDETAWRDADDPIAAITKRYVCGLERIVMQDPSQYLWGYCRWGRSESTPHHGSGHGFGSANPMMNPTAHSKHADDCTLQSSCHRPG